MSTPTLKEIQELAAWARENGLRRVKAGDVELEFAPASAPGGPMSAAQFVKLIEHIGGDAPSDEDMLMWSAGQLVRAAKAADGDGDGTDA